MRQLYINSGQLVNIAINLEKRLPRGEGKWKFLMESFHSSHIHQRRQQLEKCYILLTRFFGWRISWNQNINEVKYVRESNLQFHAISSILSHQFYTWLCVCVCVYICIYIYFFEPCYKYVSKYLHSYSYLCFHHMSRRKMLSLPMDCMHLILEWLATTSHLM